MGWLVGWYAGKLAPRNQLASCTHFDTQHTWYAHNYIIAPVAPLSGNPHRGSRPEVNFAWRNFEVAVVGKQMIVMAMVEAMVVWQWCVETNS